MNSTKPYNLRRSATTSPPENKKNLTGSLKVKSVILRKAMKRIKSIKCHVCKKVAFATAKSLNIHIETKHPHHRFLCQHWPKSYKTANGCYKHQLKHKKKRFICEMCCKGFTFPKELKEYTSKFTLARICIHALIVKGNIRETATCLHIRQPIKIQFSPVKNVAKNLTLNLI